MNTHEHLYESLKRAREMELIGQLQDSRSQYQAALSEARKIGDPELVTRVLLEFAQLLLNYDFGVDDDLSAVHEMLEESLQICSEFKDSSFESRALLLRSKFFQLKGDEQRAHEYIDEATARFQRQHDRYGLAAALHEQGRMESHSHHYAAAEEHLHQSALIFEELGNKSALGQVLLTLGVLILEYHQDIAQAKAVFSRALTILEEFGPSAEADKARKNLEAIKGLES